MSDRNKECGFLSNVKSSIKEITEEISEKNHRAALVSRLRTVIRCEEKNIEKQYAVLGRKYYEKLHSEPDPDVSGTVEILEHSFDKINEAKLHLSQLTDDEADFIIYDSAINSELPADKTDAEESAVDSAADQPVEDAEAAEYGENDELPFE